MGSDGPKDISRIFREGTLIDRAVRLAAREALLRHKQAGLPIATWRDGQVVWIPAEEIVIPPEEPQE